MHVMESEGERSPCDHSELCFAIQNTFRLFLVDDPVCEITENVLLATCLSQLMDILRTCGSPALTLAVFYEG